MYEAWYTQQYHQYNDSLNTQWDIFGLRAHSTADISGVLTRLKAEDVIAWLESGSSTSVANQDKRESTVVLSLM